MLVSSALQREVLPEGAIGREVFSATKNHDGAPMFYLSGSPSKSAPVEQGAPALEELSDDLLSGLYEALKEQAVVSKLVRSLDNMYVCEKWELTRLVEVVGEVSLTDVNVTVSTEPECPETNSSNYAPAESSLPKVSYKDALGRKAVEKPLEATTQHVILPRAKWQPKLVVRPVAPIRLDRQYGVSTVLVDEDEDLGVTDMVASHYYNKASVGVSRYRDATMLTPLEREKKDARIAEKIRATLS